MKLIIAEKPSLARNIVAGIGKMEKKNGYFINDEYIVSWAFGHLFSLADIEYYAPPKNGRARWTLENLPCFPERFHFELKKDAASHETDPGVKRQFDLLTSLCKRKDVDTVVNAGDADREGEIIVRLCVSNALGDEKKKFLRLWLPDQTPETVRSALSEMRGEEEYENLASEGFARTYIDWLYGVNLTRYATIRTGKLLRVGRVIVPIVRAIYERDLEIRNFVPDTYFVIQSAEKTNGELVELVSKNKFAKDERDKAQAMADLYNRTGAVVTDVKSKTDIIRPGKLYSLSTLQNVLGKKYKMSMKESLEIIQRLYENGYLTYPRTNSEYLATAEKDKVRAILSGVSKLGYPVRFRDSKYIFDDSKIESHSALTPTYKIPGKDKLTERENQVYSTVFRRFVAVFCSEECIAERSEINIAVGDLETFTLKGTVIQQPGWTKYDDYGQKDKILPKLAVGEVVNISFAPAEKQTVPPKHYTIETLNNYLKNPFKEDKAKAKELEESGEVDDAEDYKAVFEGLELGTEATRTGIIDNAKKSGYIDLKKDVYTIMNGGEFLINSLTELGITMDKYKTAELGKALKKVYHGEMSIDDSVKLAESEISDIFKAGEGVTSLILQADPEPTGGVYGENVGKCPLCGSPVVRGKKSYGCMGYKDGCTFKSGIVICKREITSDEMRALLERGTTRTLYGFISQKGKKFSAKLVLRDGNVVFDFAAKPTEKPGEKPAEKSAAKATAKAKVPTKRGTRATKSKE